MCPIWKPLLLKCLNAWITSIPQAKKSRKSLKCCLPKVHNLVIESYINCLFNFYPQWTEIALSGTCSRQYLHRVFWQLALCLYLPSSSSGVDAGGNQVILPIAQIAPLSFQGSHRTQTQTSEVKWLHASVVTEWSPACLHKQFPGAYHRANWRKPEMEDVHNLINIGPTNPIQILNQHEIFWRFCMCNSNDTFDKNKKSWRGYWGSTVKTGSLLGIKQT